MVAAFIPRRRPGTRATAGALLFLAFLAAALLAIAGASPAEAARRRAGKAAHGRGRGGGGGKRVGLVVTGKDARHVEKGITHVLAKHHYTAVKGKPLAAAAEVGGGLDSDGGRAAAVKRLELRAVIVGEIGGGGKRVELRVHGSDGQVLTAADFKAAGGGKKLAAAVARGLWPRLGDTLDSAKPAKPSRAEPEPEPETSPLAEAAPSKTETNPKADQAPSSSSPSDPSASDDIPAKKVARTPERDPDADADTETLEAKSNTASASSAPALDAMAGVRLVSRDLSWVKDVNRSLQPFSMPGAAAFGFQVAWYPAAHFMRGWPTQIGIAASGEYVPGISATTTDGVEFPATDSDYWGGLRGRMPFGSVDAALTLAYGQHAYALRSGAGATRADLAVPDTRYSYARLGADARVALPYRFAVMAGAAYRAVLDAGKQGFELQSASYFSRATVTAFDASAAVGYRFLPMSEARLGVDFRRYGLDMHPQATDARVVSGGVDHYLAFWANLAVMLDGHGPAAD